jgi:hypothetical protein
MPTDQALMDAIGNAGIIQLTGNANPPLWKVDVDALRTLLAKEQANLWSPHDRTDTGNIPVKQLSSGTTTKIPAVVKIGGQGDRTGRKGFQNGTTVNLKGDSGHILIALGGNGDADHNGPGGPSNGGDAAVEGKRESLLIAMGGQGGTGDDKSGNNGGKGGDALVVGEDENQAHAQGGRGGDGSMGGPHFRKGASGDGGNGGNATVKMDSNYAVLKGGDGGTGGPATTNPKGTDGDGGNGGDTSKKLGAGTVGGDDPGAPGQPGGPGGSKGHRGTKRP